MSVQRQATAAEYSGSVSPRAQLIQITATADPGQPIDEANQASDQAVKYPNGLREVRIRACNTDAVARTLNIQWGAGGPASMISVTLPALSGFVTVVDWDTIGVEFTIAAWASVASVVNVKVSKRPYVVQ